LRRAAIAVSLHNVLKPLEKPTCSYSAAREPLLCPDVVLTAGIMAVTEQEQGPWGKGFPGVLAHWLMQ
jgi:hypothetical protein